MTLYRRQLPTLSLFLAFSLAPLRVAAEDRAPGYAEAAQAFQRARVDPGALARATALFHKLAAAEPSSPLFAAYAGACGTLAGRAATAPLERLQLTEDGLRQLDGALKRLGPAHERPGPSGLPLSVETRLVAASTFLAVPDAFHRLEDGKAALAAALASPAYPHLSPAVRALFEWQRAVAARAEGRREDELGAVRKVEALAPPGGPLAAQAQARRRELSP